MLREADEADLKLLLDLNEACVGTPLWSEAVWREQLRGRPEGRVVLLAECGGVPAGFAVVQLVLDVASLESIGVQAEYRGRGIGYALGMAVCEWAREHSAVSMELEVRASNAAALHLYVRLGFTEQGRRRGYYSGPTEDAVLMEFRLYGVASANAKV